LLLNFKAYFNETKRSADNARDKAKRCLTDAQNLSGVTSPNDISPEKQEVIYYLTFTARTYVHSNMIVFQMTWEKLRS